MTSKASSYVFIPARLASTRLPEKLLLRETGKSLLQHTYLAAQQAVLPLGVTVAADDEAIVREVNRFGGQAILTASHFASGTDRIAHVAARPQFAGIEIVVNLQGDEPELPGTAIDQVVQLLERQTDAVMATLATPIRSREMLDDPSCVKVVFDREGTALYFSRAPIPHARDWRDELLAADPPLFYQHIGLYAYRRSFLLRFATLPQTPLEQLESLEQLRVLESGHKIAVGVTNHAVRGIDTPADYKAFVARQRSA